MLWQKIKGLRTGHKVLLVLSLLPVYMTYHTIRHTMVIAVAGGAREITGTIFVPDFDHDTVDEEIRVIDSHTLAPYMKPAIRWTENGAEHTALVQTDAPEYRVVGKKVRVLVHPEQPEIAKPVETALRWQSVKINLRTIMIVIILIVALWFKQIFLVFALLPAALSFSALESAFEERHENDALRGRIKEAPYRIIAETRELISAASTDSRGRRSPAIFGRFHYLQFEHPAEEYHTVRVRALSTEQMAQYKNILFKAENPQIAALKIPAPPEFWSRSMIVGISFGAFAMLLVAGQIGVNRIMRREKRKAM